MKRYHFFAFLLCGVFMSRGLSLPLRSFSIDCETLVPDFAVAPQESESPYHISFPAEEYDPGSQVKVSIEGPSDAGFKWFMLQARDIEESDPVGSFQITDPNTQAYNCYNMSNSALIHNGSDEKYNVTTLWVSPEAKKVQFVATIFQDPETYWVVIPGTALFPKGSANDSEVVNRSKEASAPGSRKKSSGITVKINCGPGGSGSYAGSSGCSTGSTFSSQGGSSKGQGVVVYQGGIKSSGCIGGGTASVYSKYGCRDSVPSISDKGKVIVFPPTEPFPPERTSSHDKYKYIQSTKYSDKIQGLRPQSGIRVTIQGGPICDKTSSSYNSQACKMSIQSSSSQSSSSYGSQGGASVIVGSSGSSPSVGVSGTTIKIGSGGLPSSVGGGSGTSIIVGGSGSSTSVGSSGSSTSSGNNPCGQGYTYDGNPCKPGGQSGSYGGSSQYGQGGQSGSYGGGSSSQYGQGGQSGSYGGGSSSQYGQGGQSGSHGGGGSQYGQGGQSGSYGGGSSSQYGQGGKGGSFGSSQYGQSGSYGSSSQYGQGGKGGSFGSSQYGQGGQSGSYGSSSQFGQGSQTGGRYSSNECGSGVASGASALSSTNCRRKRDVAAHDTFKAFIGKIRENKALPLAPIRRTRSEKVRTADVSFHGF